ncbi:MAG: hypothetical protein MUF62_00940 [Chitinophagaceae bacterium]|nr:hypothetical protein [Chitinophagaceae bacterium]
MNKLNMINRGLLNAVLWPAALYKRAGADTSLLRTILTYKLTMDDRRPNTFHRTSQQRQEKPVSTATIGTMLLAAAIGLLFIVSFFVSADALTAAVLYFSMLIVMLALTLITDFTNVLIDVRDNFIILPKPVNDATFIISRILHITIHVCKIILPMSIPGIITVIFRYHPAAAIALFAGILLATVFTIFLINVLYLLVLRFSSPERFKNIIAGIQIAFAVIIYAAYQLVPRLFSDTAMNNTEVGYNGLWLLAPPYWFAAIFKLAAQPLLRPILLVAIGLAILMPILGIWLVSRYFAPTFNRKLGQIAGSSGEAKPAAKAAITARPKYSQLLSRLITSPGLERESFLFNWKMMLRNRDFKLKVYPGIGYFLVLAIMPIIRSNKGIDGFLASLQLTESGSRFSIVVMLYMSGFVVVTSLQQLAFSDFFKAGWIFRSTPVAVPGPIQAGAAKAAIAQFFIPAFTLVSLPLLIINGWPMLVHLLTAFGSLSLLCAAVSIAGEQYLPWSAPANKQNQGGSVLIALMLLFGLAILGVIHGLLFHFPLILTGIGVAGIAGTWLIFRSLKQYSWKRISTYRY